ncbi:hypothetical protein BGX38DRAFT_1276968 [Terfezia claveryi]|nr:hypothetical protein BGX38DRAFT_1276968 [Terfezia claveryi]
MATVISATWMKASPPTSGPPKHRHIRKQRPKTKSPAIPSAPPLVHQISRNKGKSKKSTDPLPPNSPEKSTPPLTPQTPKSQQQEYEYGAQENTSQAWYAVGSTRTTRVPNRRVGKLTLLLVIYLAKDIDTRHGLRMGSKMLRTTAYNWKI